MLFALCQLGHSLSFPGSHNWETNLLGRYPTSIPKFSSNFIQLSSIFDKDNIFINNENILGPMEWTTTILKQLHYFLVIPEIGVGLHMWQYSKHYYINLVIVWIL